MNSILGPDNLDHITYLDDMKAHLATLTYHQREDAILVMRQPHGLRYVINDIIVALPTMHQGQDANLKLEWFTNYPYLDGCGNDNSSHYRVWVSRMTKEDGAKYDRGIIVEHRYTNGWREKWGWRQFTRAQQAFSSAA